jgi:uncharacterized protein (DUF488 family)
MTSGIKVFTIGHSTRPIEEFIGLLEAHGIRRLIDVRTIPRSRFNPQSNSDALARELSRRSISYRHCPGLGGLRKPEKDSKNAAWRNASFRGYADYMGTPEFEKNLIGLIGDAEKERTAVMCAEAVPWRCHRSLIADALYARGIPAFHITGSGKAAVHVLTDFAKVSGKKVGYPAKNVQAEFGFKVEAKKKKRKKKL